MNTDVFETISIDAIVLARTKGTQSTSRFMHCSCNELLAILKSKVKQQQKYTLNYTKGLQLPTQEIEMQPLTSNTPTKGHPLND